DDASWHSFRPSAEEVEHARRLLAGEQGARAAAALAAGHLLARAALDAFASAPGAGQARLAYALFDLDEYDPARSDSVRVRLICEKLGKLLSDRAPEAPPEEVQRIVQERLKAAQGQAHPAGLAPARQRPRVAFASRAAPADAAPPGREKACPAAETCVIESRCRCGSSPPPRDVFFRTPPPVSGSPAPSLVATDGPCAVSSIPGYLWHGTRPLPTVRHRRLD